MKKPHDIFYEQANLNQRTVLITGASSGIGAACAKLFAQYGARLILCARRQERLSALAKQLIDAYSVSVQCLVFDVSDASDTAEKLNRLPIEWRAIDVLINSAGLALGLDTLYEGNLADWSTMIDTNIKGVLHVSRQVLPWMVERDVGHVINLGSISSHHVYKGGGVYCATKHALDAITRTLRFDLFDTNIRVTSINPGMVETEFSVVRFSGDVKRAASVYEDTHPLTPDDIANSILYCVAAPSHVNVSEITILPTTQLSVDKVRRHKKTVHAHDKE